MIRYSVFGTAFTVILLILASMSICESGESPLEIRGTATTLPFHLGTSLYNGAWAGFADNDSSADWWWYDKDQWTQTFRRYRDARLNTIVYWHPHPFVGFIKFNKFPEAAFLTSEQTDRSIEMFRWITAEGKKHGVSIYFLTWNICLPPGMCKTNGQEEFGSDTPLVREYTRYAVKELFRTYPDLGGLVTMAAEAPPGCTDFVLKAVVPGMIDSVGGDSPRKTLPRLIYWTWCSYPEEGKEILDAYPGEKYALHYLQYEQFFKPMADPRILMTSQAFDGIKVVAMGGPSTATGWLYWGDPFFVQKSMRDLVEKNGGGILFSGTDSFAFIAERWVAREAFERYSNDPFVKDSPAYWTSRIAERYGSRPISRPLLRAMIDSSNIIPRFMCLVHSQTDHYNPQIGMPLVNYLEMPTLSTYVFENHDYIDEKGRIVPSMGLTWPNPHWGEDVVSIREYVKSELTGVGDATTPDDIASEVERLSRSSLRSISLVRVKLDTATGGRKELENTLSLMEMNSHLGLHYTEKIRAGIAWESWKVGLPGSDPSTVLMHLDRSITHWRDLCEASSPVVPNAVRLWQSRVPSEPPWDHWDLWNNYHWVRIHWRDVTPIFERERDLIARQLQGSRENARLPLFPELDVPPIGETIHRFDFEEKWPDDLIASNLPGVEVRVSDRIGEVINGGSSLFCDTRNSSTEWNIYLRTDSNAVRLIPGEKYVVEFDYRIIDPGEQRQPFAIAGRTVKGGETRDIGDYRFWSGAAGQTGSKVITLEPEEFDDYHIFFLIRGKAAVILDNITISKVLRGEKP